MEQNVAFMTSPIGDLPINSDGLRKAVDEIARLNKEIVQLKEDREKCINALSDEYSFKTTQDGMLRVFDIVREVAVKEFAEKLKTKCFNSYPICINVIEETEIDNLLKEYGVEL